MNEEAGTLAALLRAGAPAHPAVVVPDGGTTLNFGALEEAVGGLAGVLAAAGAERGDRVALVLPNGPDFLQALLAVAWIGAAAAPLNPSYTRDEYSFYLEDLAPRLLLLPPGEIPAARAAVPESTQVADVLVQDGRPAALDLRGNSLRRGRTFEAARPEDTALLLHTSGTTSRPKQVPLLHRNLTASARMIASHYRLDSSDVSYCAMPLFHVHGLVASALGALAAGGSVVLPARFSARRFWRQAGPHGVTWLSAGPTIHEMVLERSVPDAGVGNLRFLRSCSSALSPSLMARLEDHYAVPVLEAYGMTEASHQISSNPLPPAPRYPASVGVATGTEISIVDEEGRHRAPGEAGEVVIRGPGVTPGYLNNPEANSEAFFDGWFRTGDLGVLDESGYLRLKGRLKEMIIRGGENISPYEVEDVLLVHAAVDDAVCFGVPNDKYGEEVAAAVTLSGETTTGQLTAWCRDRLAPFKVPRTIHVVDEIPRTPTGKLQRRRVAEIIREAS